jgi:hypothetical protein
VEYVLKIIFVPEIHFKFNYCRVSGGINKIKIKKLLFVLDPKTFAISIINAKKETQAFYAKNAKKVIKRNILFQGVKDALIYQSR